MLQDFSVKNFFCIREEQTLSFVPNADKDKCGATALKRLSNLGLHKTLSPYYAYRQGKLVALLSFGSVYLDKLQF